MHEYLSISNAEENFLNKRLGILGSILVIKIQNILINGENPKL
jgi:hypothetical protein